MSNSILAAVVITEAILLVLLVRMFIQKRDTERKYDALYKQYSVQRREVLDLTLERDQCARKLASLESAHA